MRCTNKTGATAHHPTRTVYSERAGPGTGRVLLNPMLCLLAGFAIVFALFCVWTLSLYLSFGRTAHIGLTFHPFNGGVSPHPKDDEYICGL
jgi:hypothetical protein